MIALVMGRRFGTMERTADDDMEIRRAGHTPHIKVVSGSVFTTRSEGCIRGFLLSELSVFSPMKDQVVMIGNEPIGHDFAILVIGLIDDDDAVAMIEIEDFRQHGGRFVENDFVARVMKRARRAFVITLVFDSMIHNASLDGGMVVSPKSDAKVGVCVFKNPHKDTMKISNTKKVLGANLH